MIEWLRMSLWFVASRNKQVEFIKWYIRWMIGKRFVDEIHSINLEHGHGWWEQKKALQHMHPPPADRIRVFPKFVLWPNVSPTPSSGIKTRF